MKMKWRTTVGSEILFSSPRVSKGIVYLGSTSGFFALDSADGRILWSLQGATVHNTPAIENGRVFFGTQRLAIHSNESYVQLIHRCGFCALEEGNGRLVWQIKTPSSVEASPIVCERTIFFGDMNGFVYAVDASTGQELRKLQVPRAVRAVARCGSRLCISTWEGIVCSIDSATFETNWSTRVPCYERRPTSICIQGDKVYVGTREGCWCLDLSNGRENWRFDTRGDIGDLVSNDDDVVFAHSGDRHLYAIAATGELKWRFEVGYGGALTIAKNLVFCGSNEGILLGIDAESGKQLIREQLAEAIHGAPQCAENVLYVGTRGKGEVYAFELI